MLFVCIVLYCKVLGVFKNCSFPLTEYAVDLHLNPCPLLTHFVLSLQVGAKGGPEWTDVLC